MEQKKKRIIPRISQGELDNKEEYTSQCVSDSNNFEMDNSETDHIYARMSILSEDESQMECDASECEFVNSTLSADSAVKLRKGKKRRIDQNKEFDESVVDAELFQLTQDKSMEELWQLSASAVAARAFEWLLAVDQARAKSRNIQGSTSGSMKKKLAMIKKAVSVLLLRVNAAGDPQHLKQKMESQTLEILELKADIQRARENASRYREQLVEMDPANKERYINKGEKLTRVAATKGNMARMKNNATEVDVTSDDVFAVPTRIYSNEEQETRTWILQQCRNPPGFPRNDGDAYRKEPEQQTHPSYLQ